MLKNKSLAIIICLAGLTPTVSIGHLYFNPKGLRINPDDKSMGQINLSTFETSSLLPGSYRSQVYVNDTYVETKKISYNITDGFFTPVITLKDLKNWGVKTAMLNEIRGNADDEEIKSPGKRLLPLKFYYSLNDERLNISVPQAYLCTTANVDAPRTMWDQGVSAFFTTYNINGVKSSGANNANSSLYLRLSNGLNIGAWRLRNNSSFQRQSDGRKRFYALTNYLQRDVQSLNAQFVAGRISTSSALFDSVRMDGAAVYSDTSMLPYNQQGLAPTIRGIAKSDAQITVNQNGRTIYQTSVPAGPFAISDISSLSNGNLLVTVREADGSEHSFNQFFAAVPGMQREDHMRFATNFGKYLSTLPGGKEPYFFQHDMAYGVNNYLTTYAGTQIAPNYMSLQAGTGLGMMDYGAISGDITYARSRLTNGDRDKGESFRVQYAKSLNNIGTDLTLAGYRYSTAGFYDFSETNDLTVSNTYSSIGNNKKTRIQLQINQNFGTLGGIALTAYYQNFWNTHHQERNTSLSYNTDIKDIFYSIDYMTSKISGQSSSDNLVSLNISVPLDKFLPSAWSSYGISRSSSGDINQNLSLYGNFEHDPTWSYDIRSQQNHSSGYGGSASLSHNNQYGMFSASYSYDPDYRQTNFNAAGGIVFHDDGVTLSQPLYGPFAIIHTNGAEHIQLKNHRDIYTDSKGNAILPYLSPYHKNRVDLDTNTFPDDFDFDNLTTMIVPTEGAIIRTDFGGFKGYQAFIHLTHRGAMIPFGTMVKLITNKTITGIVDEKGLVYLKGIPASGILMVQWGRRSDQQCRSDFKVKNTDTVLQQLSLECI